MSEQTITLIAAIAFTIVGVGAFVHLFVIVNGWPRATGRVVGNEAKADTRSGFGEYSYFPRVAFQAADGRPYEITGDIGLTREWHLGQAVRLRYRATNPEHASILAGWQRLLFATVFLGFAAALWGAWFGVLG